MWDTKNREWKQRIARMDIVATFPSSLVQWWLDVSVRSIHAERYPDMPAHAGLAARAGEHEKKVRYGTGVKAIVFETQGRLGAQGAAALRDLAVATSASGQVSPRIATLWRTQLERAVIAAVADNMVRAIGAGNRTLWATASQKRSSFHVDREGEWS